MDGLMVGGLEIPPVPAFDTKEERKVYALHLRGMGLDYCQIAEVLDISKSTAWGICTGKKEPKHPRKRLADATTPVMQAPRSVLTCHSVGTSTELLIAARLLSLGFDVWKPLVPSHRCDLGVYESGRLVRLQTKTAGWSEHGKRYRTALMTKTGGKRMRYHDGEFEFFIVKCAGLEEYYVIPTATGNRSGSVSLFPHRKRLMLQVSSWEQYRNNFDQLKAGRE